MKKPENKNIIKPNTPQQPAGQPPIHTDGLRPAPRKPNVGIDLETKKHPLRKLWRNHKKAVIIGSLIGIIIITAGTILAVQAFRKPKPVAEVASTPEPSPTPTPTPLTQPSRLTGLEVTPEKANQPIMASIVENLGGTGGARPQSGLSSAGVVYEAIAEGGITRYLALWQADVPADIGPVRSLRPVFFDTAMEYGAPVAHAGGSSDALSNVQNTKGFKDMDQFYNGNYFRRINTRYAPHNLYIYGPKLTEMVKAKGWGAAPTFTPWQRKDDAPAATPSASTITADYSSSMYTATFTYEAASNSYVRSVGGARDVDAANNNVPVKPKTVITLYTANITGTQANGKPKTDINIVGNGKGMIFQDGTATAITWSKASTTGRMTFKDASGAEIKLNRGQSWVCILPLDRPATYK